MEHDFEKKERIKYTVIDWIFNALLIILAIFAVYGAQYLLGDFLEDLDISYTYAYSIFIVVFIGLCYIWNAHKESKRYWKGKAIKERLKAPKFDYLTDQQKQEIELEIKNILYL